MFLNDLLSKWSDSLEIFKKKNFILFSLASLNTFRRSLILLVTYFWGIFLAFLAFELYFTFWGHQFVPAYSNIVFSVLRPFLYFYAILAARPSIERKDMQYFASYMQKFMGVFGVFLFFMYFPFQPLLFPFLLFAFHYLDSKSGFKNCFISFFKALKIVFYFFSRIFNIWCSKVVI